MIAFYSQLKGLGFKLVWLMLGEKNRMVVVKLFKEFVE